MVPDGDLADYVHGRFETTGKSVESAAISALLDLVRGHPQRAMVASHYLWDETSEVAGVEQWDAAYGRLMRDLDDEMRTVWIGLSRDDRVTLPNIATGRGPYASGGGGVERSGGAAKASVMVVLSVVSGPPARVPGQAALRSWPHGVYTRLTSYILEGVTKHLIDLDEEALSRAQAELGTATIRDTVNLALERATSNRHMRVVAALDVLAGTDLEDRSEAWR